MSVNHALGTAGAAIRIIPRKDGDGKRNRTPEIGFGDRRFATSLYRRALAGAEGLKPPLQGFGDPVTTAILRP